MKARGLCLTPRDGNGVHQACGDLVESFFGHNFLYLFSDKRLERVAFLLLHFRSRTPGPPRPLSRAVLTAISVRTRTLGTPSAFLNFSECLEYQRRIFRRDPERTTANALARLVCITPNGLFFFTGRLPLMLQHGARAVINSASILRASAKSFVHKFYLYFILPDAAHVLAPL